MTYDVTGGFPAWLLNRRKVDDTGQEFVTDQRAGVK